MMLPRISPPTNCEVWKLMYERPARILPNCAAKVVPLPSGGSHLPLNVPPTPVANGVETASLGLLSLNGMPKNPQTTGPFVVGVTPGPAWMWAFPKLSFVSAVWEPVTSILKIVAVNVICGIASFNTNVAIPNDAGLGAPVVRVGTVGGFSAPLLKLAKRLMVAASAVAPA